MQQIIQINKPSTMSSRDISELTGKNTKTSVVTYRNMLDVLGKDRLSFEHIFKNAYGRDQQEFRLNRELTLTLVSGFPNIPLPPSCRYASRRVGISPITEPGKPISDATYRVGDAGRARTATAETQSRRT